jgi:hypothetical protein
VSLEEDEESGDGREEHGIEIRQLLEDREGRIPRRLVRCTVAPLPAAGIRINEQLKPLQHPVVRQRVRGLFQIDRQLIRLDAAEGEPSPGMCA